MMYNVHDFVLMKLLEVTVELLRKFLYQVSQYVHSCYGCRSRWGLWQPVHYASPQIEEVITTSEGRIGLLGDWREVPPPPSVWECGGVCFNDCSLFPPVVSLWYLMMVPVNKIWLPSAESLNQCRLAEDKCDSCLFPPSGKRHLFIPFKKKM